MANRYWVGVGNWDNNASSKWSTTSGGVGGAAEPTSSDDVFFDTGSGTGTVAITATSAAKSLNTTGYVGTISGSSRLDLSGNLVVGSNTVFSHTGEKRFIATGTITTNGVTVGGDIGINGSGIIVTLQDDLTITEDIILVQGTFDANDMNVSCQNTDRSGSSTFVLNMGSGTWELSASSGTVFETFPSTGLTINAETSTIKVVNTDGGAVLFDGGGYTFNKLWFDRGSNTANISVLGSNTFAELKDTGTAAHSILFGTGTTQHITTWSIRGNIYNLITVSSNTTGTHTLVKDGGGTVQTDFLTVQHSIATPANTWYLGVNSIDNQSTPTAGSGWIQGWTGVFKPSESTYINVNPQGKEQYDEANIQYDESTVFYDGLNPNQWTDVAKPVTPVWTDVAKPT